MAHHCAIMMPSVGPLLLWARPEACDEVPDRCTLLLSCYDTGQSRISTNNCLWCFRANLYLLFWAFELLWKIFLKRMMSTSFAESVAQTTHHTGCCFFFYILLPEKWAESQRIWGEWGEAASSFPHLSLFSFQTSLPKLIPMHGISIQGIYSENAVWRVFRTERTRG